MAELTPKQIFNSYMNGKIDKSTIYNYLQAIIENEKVNDVRLEALKILEEVCDYSDKVYKFIENLLLSDFDEIIRANAARLIIIKYLEKGEKAIKWAIRHEKSSKCLISIYKTLLSIKSSESSQLMKFFTEVFSHKLNKERQEYIIEPIKEFDIIVLGILERITGVELIPTGFGFHSNKLLIFIRADGYIQDIRIKNWSEAQLGSLQFLSNLWNLGIENSIISDFTFMTNLKDLTSLTLSNCNISAISLIKELISLKKLVYLDLSSNMIKKIEGLQYFNHLKSLSLSENSIEKIEGLENLTSLISLDLSLNKISEIEGLDTIQSLEHLILSFNNINELKGLEKLHTLINVEIGDNPIYETVLKILGYQMSLEDAYKRFHQGFYNKDVKKLIEYCKNQMDP